MDKQQASLGEAIDVLEGAIDVLVHIEFPSGKTGSLPPMKTKVKGGGALRVLVFVYDGYFEISLYLVKDGEMLEIRGEYTQELKALATLDDLKRSLRVLTREALRKAVFRLHRRLDFLKPPQESSSKLAGYTSGPLLTS